MPKFLVRYTQMKPNIFNRATQYQLSHTEAVVQHTKIRRDDKFVVLIGSRARQDADERSDSDVLQIGKVDDITLQMLCSQLPQVSEIILTNVNFRKFYTAGSLFLQHVFSEGVLLYGCPARWNVLQQNFTVKKDFTSEIGKYCELRYLLQNLDIFDGHYLMALVNSFTYVKNASIFFLANLEMYHFNKQYAIRRACNEVNFANFDCLYELKDFYDYSVRNANIRLPFDPTCKVRGQLALECGLEFLARISHASF